MLHRRLAFVNSSSASTISQKFLQNNNVISSTSSSRFMMKNFQQQQSSSSSFSCYSLGLFSQSNILLAKARNPYKVLGVPQGASEKDIKAAYRKKAIAVHPDRPGGSHEKFQEVQEAYEQIKTGVWIPKDGGSGGAEGSNPVGDRFGRFTYKTASKQNVSFDQFMREMRDAERGKAPKNSGPDTDTTPEGEEVELDAEGKPIPKKKKRINPQDIRIAAWFRLLSLWAVVFLSLRFAMLLIFPPKVEKKQKPKAPNVIRAKREPPPPARLQTSGGY